MRIGVATLDGLSALDVSRADLPYVLDDLADVSAEEIARGDAPPWDDVRARYAIDRPTDCYQSAGVTARRGAGDCEDLSAYLAGTLRLAGIPATMEVVPTGRSTGHVVVGAGDVYADPSVERGMRLPPIRWRVTRDRRTGLYGARAAWPDSLGNGYRVETRGSDPAGALALAGDIVLSGLGDTVGGLAGGAIGGPIGGAVGDAVGGVVDSITGAIASWASGAQGYEPLSDFLKATCRSSGIAASGNPQRDLAALLAIGTIPIYCSDSVGTRDAIRSQFGSRGWPVRPWSQSYDRGFSRRAWYYGASVTMADCPPAIRDAAQAASAADPISAIRKTVYLCSDAKGRIGATAAADWDAIVREAVLPRDTSAALAAVTPPADSASRSAPSLPQVSPGVTPGLATNQAADATAAAAAGRAVIQDAWDAVGILARQLDSASNLKRVLRSLR